MNNRQPLSAASKRDIQRAQALLLTGDDVGGFDDHDAIKLETLHDADRHHRYSHRETHARRLAVLDAGVIERNRNGFEHRISYYGPESQELLGRLLNQYHKVPKGFQALLTPVKFEELKSEETELVSVGLSPHSPYTVGSQLLELIAQYAILNRVPLSIHAAESRDEHDLMTKGTGFFTSVYEKFGIEWQSPHCTPIEYLTRLGVLSTQPLLAHCVTVSDSDIQKIAANGAKIAHCPKSNAKFGHGYAPFEAFLDAGIAVGLGSDSVASNNTCDLLEESRFATLSARNRTGSARFISAKEMLETATLGGAKALGLEHLIGTLEPGKQADIAVISLAHVAQQPVNDIHTALIFASNARDVIQTYVAGKAIVTS